MLLRPGLIRGKPASNLIVMGASGLSPLFTFSRTQSNSSLTTALNSAGTDYDFYAASTPRYQGAARNLLIEGARTNLILNSATGVTQDVTVAAAAHTISFEGTGTVTLSGVHVAVVNGLGTGVTNRVTSTFTPTAGTLTCTVAGSVTRLQVEAGGFASSYIETLSGTGARGADTISRALSILNLPASGNMIALIKGFRTTLTAGINQVLISNDDGSTNNQYLWLGSSASANHIVTRRIAAAAASSSTITGPSAGTLYRSGLRINNGVADGFIVGQTMQGVTGGPTSGLTTLRIGRGAATDYYWGELASLTILRNNLDDAGFQAAVTNIP